MLVGIGLLRERTRDAGTCFLSKVMGTDRAGLEYRKCPGPVPNCRIATQFPAYLLWQQQNRAQKSYLMLANARRSPIIMSLTNRICPRAFYSQQLAPNCHPARC